MGEAGRGHRGFYRRINRARRPPRVLDNILEASRARPLVIQSLWMKIHDQPPPEAEIDALADRLREIVSAGGGIRLVQAYTTARWTTEPYVTPLDGQTLVAIGAGIQARAQVPVVVYT